MVGSREPKHVTLRDMTLKCCVGQRIFVSFWLMIIEIICNVIISCPICNSAFVFQIRACRRDITDVT